MVAYEKNNPTLALCFLESARIMITVMVKRLTSVESALKVLDSFIANSEMTLSEISEQTGVHKSTVFRTVKTLEANAYLERVPDSNKYKLGQHIIMLATAKIDTLELQIEARPFLLRLQAKTNCSIHLSVLEKTDVSYLFIIDDYSATRTSTRNPKKNPAYCSSGGKCLLSALSGDTVNKLFANYEFKRFTDKTICSLEELKEELAQIRKQGYAVNRGEMEAQVGSIAFPVFGYSGEMIAAISVGTHLDRMDEKTLETIKHYTKDFANQLSANMGYIV